MAPDVIAAFETAERAGLSLRDCYLASVEISVAGPTPEQRREYAAMQATAIILKIRRLSLLIPRDDLTAHADPTPDCSSDRVEPS